MNGPAETIRSFIALELSGQVREELARIIGILKGSGADVKWMKPGSIHLTLKFLGNIPPEKAHEISDRLKDIAVNARPYSLTLDGIGVFPGWGYARVIWVGIGEGSLETSRLAGEIDKAMVEEGFEKEKRAFSPHLTLGRIRRAKNKDRLKGLADSLEVAPAESQISKIVLFRSVLTREGSIYTPLETAALGK